MVDHYCNPGPIQYCDVGCDDRSHTLNVQFEVQETLRDEIKSICHAIHNQTLFADHEHLLVGALSALKAAKQVLSSKTESTVMRRDKY